MNQKIKILFLIALISAFFPYSFHLYVQVGLAVVIFGIIMWDVYKSILRPIDLMSHYTILMAIWMLWSLLSIFWVKDHAGWLFSNGILVISFVHSLSIRLLLKGKNFKKDLFQVLFGIIVIHNLIGWFEWLTMQQYFLTEQLNFDLTYFMWNPMIFFGNVNDFALLMLFGVVLTLKWPTFWPGNQSLLSWRRLVQIVLIVSNLLLIYLVHSRGILFAAVYSIIFYNIMDIKKVSLRRTLLAGIILLSAATILVMFTNIISYLAQEGSFVVRLNLIRNGWHHLKMSDYIGVGAGNIEYYMANFRYYPTADYNVMHNWWMGTLTAYGAGFFVIYAIYHIYVFILSYLSGVNHHASGKFVATWLLGFIIAGMIPNTLFMFVWFWLIHNIVFVVFEASKVEMVESMVTSEDGISRWFGARLQRNQIVE